MKKLLLIAGIFFAFYTANSQTNSPELISSSGDSFSNVNYILDWSIGELATETISANGQILTQGFHQGIYTVTAIEDLRADIEMTVFPNPTTDFITLNFAKVQNFGKLSYTITDFSGKVLQNSNFSNETEQINFAKYSAGTYFIIVQENNQIIKSFKIIKK
jgi:hypothetical protein